MFELWACQICRCEAVAGGGIRLGDACSMTRRVNGGVVEMDTRKNGRGRSEFMRQKGIAC
jgi:hypothetical protein